MERLVKEIVVRSTVIIPISAAMQNARLNAAGFEGELVKQDDKRYGSAHYNFAT